MLHRPSAGAGEGLALRVNELARTVMGATLSSRDDCAISRGDLLPEVQS